MSGLRMKNRAIKQYRRRIDMIDGKIMKLFVKRCQAVELIGRIKNEEGISVVDKKREQEILLRIEGLGAGRVIKNFIRKIYESIFSASYMLEKNE